MSKKLFDFLSSFGIMLAGVGLLFFSTIAFTKINKKENVFLIPKHLSHAQVGGDLPVKPPEKIRPQVPLKKDQSTNNVSSTATAILAVEDKTSTVLYSKNIDEIRPIASITKLMSAAILFESNIDWSTTTIITEEDIDSDTKYVKKGEEFTAEDLWHIALIGSSNSAVNALVRLTGMSNDVFVEKMNIKAKLWRLNNTVFVEPTGLDARNVASARDVVVMLKNVLNIERIKNTLVIGEYYAKPIGQKSRRVWTTDWLLTDWIKNDFSEGAVVGKTGYIAASKYNFTARMEDQSGRAIRVAVLGAATNEARFTEARDIANWVFEHYLWPQDVGYDQLAK